jgi:hypothetical protein
VEKPSKTETQFMVSELVACQVMLLAIINSTPDKRALLSQYQAVCATATAAMTTSRMYGTEMLKDIQQAMTRYEAQIRTQLDQESG